MCTNIKDDIKQTKTTWICIATCTVRYKHLTMYTLTEIMSRFCDYSSGTSHDLLCWWDARQYWVWNYWSVLNCRKPFTLCLIVLTDIMAVGTAFLESLGGGLDKCNWIKWRDLIICNSCSVLNPDHRKLFQRKNLHLLYFRKV